MDIQQIMHVARDVVDTHDKKEKDKDKKKDRDKKSDEDEDEDEKKGRDTNSDDDGEEKEHCDRRYKVLANHGSSQVRICSAFRRYVRRSPSPTLSFHF